MRRVFSLWLILRLWLSSVVVALIVITRRVLLLSFGNLFFFLGRAIVIASLLRKTSGCPEGNRRSNHKHRQNSSQVFHRPIAASVHLSINAEERRGAAPPEFLQSRCQSQLFD